MCQGKHCVTYFMYFKSLAFLKALWENYSYAQSTNEETDTEKLGHLVKIFVSDKGRFEYRYFLQ